MSRLSQWKKHVEFSGLMRSSKLWRHLRLRALREYEKSSEQAIRHSRRGSKRRLWSQQETSNCEVSMTVGLGSSKVTPVMGTAQDEEVNERKRWNYTMTF
jgi:hypothetical protein